MIAPLGDAEPLSAAITGVMETHLLTNNLIFFTPAERDLLQGLHADTSLGESFFLSNIVNLCCVQAQGLAVYDQGTYRLTNLVDLHNPAIEGSSSYSPASVRWGQDGLAALASTGDLYLLRGPLVVSQLLTLNIGAVLASSPTLSLAHGGGNTPLSISGSNFMPGVAVLWNRSYRTTTIVDATHLSVAIPSTDLISPGAATVTAVNPDAPVSNPLVIVIN